MKILRMRLTNLNSLRGEFAVDFTEPPLADAGLFAITGPTGAGKTTLLDAMTLALFGRAARYGSERSPEEMMSRQTGTCSAEVEFSCAAGVFRSTWHLRRSRSRPGGNLQPAVRRVIQLPEELVLTQRIEDSDRKIEELTGLDYDRFLRSVMLAQGEFAAFLRAKVSDRAELLEQVTGTAIYSEISRAAYRYAEAAERHLQDLRQRHDFAAVLSDEARAERETELAALAGRLGELREANAATALRIGQARTLLACGAEAARIEAEAVRLAAERAAVGAELAALEQHEKAGPFIARLAKSDLLTRLRTEDESRLNVGRIALPALAERCAAAAVEAASAAQALKAAETAEEDSKPLWNAVVVLDGEIAVKRQALTRRSEVRAQAEAALSSLRQELGAKVITLQAQQQAQAELTNWLNARPADAGLAAALADVQTAWVRWCERSSEEAAVRAEVARLEGDLRARVRQVEVTAAEVAGLQAERSRTAAEVRRLRAEGSRSGEERSIGDWEQDRDQVQIRLARWQELQALSREVVSGRTRDAELQRVVESQAAQEVSWKLEATQRSERLRDALDLKTSRQKSLDLIRRVQSLEQHRTELQDGEPCPLCGARSHPFASPVNLPAQELGVALADLKAVEAQVADQQRALQALELRRTAARTEAERAALERKTLAEHLGSAERQWRAKQEELGLAPATQPEPGWDELVAAENARLIALRQRVEKLRALDRDLRRAEQSAAGAQTRWQEKSAELDKRRSLLAQAQANVNRTAERAATATAAVTAARAGFGEVAAEFVVDPVPDLAAAEAALVALKDRAAAFADRIRARGLLEAEVAATQAGLTERQRQSDAEAIKLETLRAEEQREQQAWQVLLGQRAEKFGTKEVASEQRQAAERIRAARQRAESVAALLAQARQKEGECRREIEALEQAIARRGADLAESNATLAADAAGAGFASIDHLRVAVLPDAAVAPAIALRNRLTRDEQTLQGRRRANDEARAALPQSTADDAAALDALVARQADFDAERESHERRRGAVLGELQQDDARRLAQTEMAGQIEAAGREHQRWQRLSQLIGSANGAAFSRFAQGLTLERLVAVANRHLGQLSPRYSMRRAEGGADDLDLEIIDHYQGDVTRGMRSLSGGESFLASLALAVGLSDLASGRTAIESLFIDEGFGSLDPATLETAMGALEGLQTHGKMIGVISHVEAMQERIPVQIRVQKRHGGRSSIEVG